MILRWQLLVAVWASTALPFLKYDSASALFVTPSPKKWVDSSAAHVAGSSSVSSMVISRRAILSSAASALVSVGMPTTSLAVADCYSDCLKNCKKIAPNDADYCVSNCIEYCSQDDRRDGLSGSVSSEGGEVGLLGGTFGQGTVPKGEDKVSLLRKFWRERRKGGREEAVCCSHR